MHVLRVRWWSAAAGTRGPAARAGRHMVKVEPVPGLLHSRTCAAVVGQHVLDDREPEPGPAGRPGAGRVDAEEPLEHARLVLRGDADAAVRHRDLDGVADAAARHRHRRLPRRVRDGVLHQVAQGGDQQRRGRRRPPARTGGRRVISMPADSAESRQRASASLTSSSTSTAHSSGSRSAPVSRDSAISSVTSAPSRVDSLRMRVAKRRTSAGSSAASSTASASRPTAPTGVFSSWLDVRDEVAPGGLQPHGLGGVGRLDDREPVAERADLRRDGGRLAARGARAARGRPRRGARRRRASACRHAVRARGSTTPARTTPRSTARGLCSTTSPVRVSTARPASDERNTRSRRSARRRAASRSAAGPGVRARRRRRAARAAATAAERDAADEPEQQRDRGQQEGRHARSRPHRRRAARRFPRRRDLHDRPARHISTGVHAAFTRGARRPPPPSERASHGRQKVEASS